MSRPFSVFLQDYQWIHLSLGLIGNISFVVGSVFFLYEDLKTAGTWLFIIGSAGMLLGSLGEAVIKIWRVEERDRHRRADESAHRNR